MASLTDELEPLAESLRADGADLRLEGVADGTVRVRLVLGPDACEECILAKEHLEAVLTAALQEADPTVVAVTVEDPREQGSA
jgi:Fe-S cluster biogenesis protein NfuA